MNESNVHGSCLCGAVTFEVSPPFQRMIHCHCSRCRKGTGTGHATNLTTNPDQLRWLTGEDSITRYDLPTAKSFGKWFCSHCGSPVPRLTRNGKIIVIPGVQQIAAIGRRYREFVEVFEDVKSETAEPR